MEFPITAPLCTIQYNKNSISSAPPTSTTAGALHISLQFTRRTQTVAPTRTGPGPLQSLLQQFDHSVQTKSRKLKRCYRYLNVTIYGI